MQKKEMQERSLNWAFVTKMVMVLNSHTQKL